MPLTVLVYFDKLRHANSEVSEIELRGTSFEFFQSLIAINCF